jgi:hypothetical protein
MAWPDLTDAPALFISVARKEVIGMSREEVFKLTSLASCAG